MNISPDVMIMTRAEFKAAEDRAFQRGVVQGRFEQSWDASRGDSSKAEQDDKTPAYERLYTLINKKVERFIQDNGREPLIEEIFPAAVAEKIDSHRMKD